MSQLKRITPEAHFPEAESAPGVANPTHRGRHKPRGEAFGQPWPLSEDFYLCVYDPSMNRHGIYLVDSFGNRELLYRDDKIGCLDPIPLKPRPRPPVIPVQTVQAKADQLGGEDLGMGTVSVMNVYEGEYDWPEGTVIKALRIVNLFPKPNVTINKPNIGVAPQSLARGVFGTVPVEADGSAHFKCPTGVPIYFQALDENGVMVQNMRSATYLHPGENMSCIGCHESKHQPPNVTGVPQALRRTPSDITPEPTGSYPLTFPRLVYPVIEKRCQACHAREEKAPTMGSAKQAFDALKKYAWGKAGGNGGIRRNGRSYSIPGQEGACVSTLYAILQKGHHKVVLTPEEWRRITLWLDCNSNFYGAYCDEPAQQRGELVMPLLGLPPHLPHDKLVR